MLRERALSLFCCLFADSGHVLFPSIGKKELLAQTEEKKSLVRDAIQLASHDRHPLPTAGQVDPPRLIPFLHQWSAPSVLNERL